MIWNSLNLQNNVLSLFVYEISYQLILFIDWIFHVNRQSWFESTAFKTLKFC